MFGSDRRSVSADEQETTINFFPPSISSVVNVYSCIPSEIRYYLRLAEEYPEDVKIVRDDGYRIDVELPSSWYRRPKPPIRRVFTEEQRAAAAERMKAIREKRKEVNAT